MGLQPRTVRVVRDGTESDVLIAAVVRGDLVPVRPCEKVAVDGIVVEGSSAVNRVRRHRRAHPGHLAPRCVLYLGRDEEPDLLTGVLGAPFAQGPPGPQPLRGGCSRGAATSWNVAPRPSIC
jgi:hypothetical protein